MVVYLALSVACVDYSNRGDSWYVARGPFLMAG